MARTNSTIPANDMTNSMPFFKIGQERTQAATALQKELLEAYDHAGRAWLARVRSEAALWTELVTTLTATRSVSDSVQAYTKCVSQQMKMTAEDGQHLFNDCQEITQKLTKALAHRWPSGSA
jgi:uncharacterized protein (DUF885 family)